nr:MAG TPA: protein of unknown function (DUF4969) [Caudoviricetes sp.]
MKKLLPLIAVFAVLFLITACKKNVKDQNQTEVVNQEKEDKHKKVVHPYYHTYYYNMRHYHKASTRHFHH